MIFKNLVDPSESLCTKYTSWNPEVTSFRPQEEELLAHSPSPSLEIYSVRVRSTMHWTGRTPTIPYAIALWNTMYVWYRWKTHFVMLYETEKLRLKLFNRESAKNPNLVHVPTESSVRKSCTTTYADAIFPEPLLLITFWCRFSCSAEIASSSAGTYCMYCTYIHTYMPLIDYSAPNQKS